MKAPELKVDLQSACSSGVRERSERDDCRICVFRYIPRRGIQPLGQLPDWFCGGDNNAKTHGHSDGNANWRQ